MKMPYNKIFKFPERCILNKRLTKAFFLKNFVLTAAEKKLLNSTIQSMEWLASIKTSNANISAVINDEYVYEEIQVMICTLPNNQLEIHGKKCIELFQKYIPYQLIVIVEDEHDFIINTCDKKVNQNDKNKRTIENTFSTSILSKLYKDELTASFFNLLAFQHIDKTNMQTTYKNYIQAVVQFQAASITGKYSKRTQKRTEEDMLNILAIEDIEKEISSFTKKIKKETQLNKKVELNMSIQKKRQKIEEIKNKLT